MYGNAPGPELFSQATQRSFAIFTDQHGRRWGADIEKKTGAPCGPLAIRTGEADVRQQPPLLPPQKYLVVDALARTLVVDYDRWLTELNEAHHEYGERLRSESVRLYGTKGLQAVKDKDPELFHVVGEPPAPREQVLAAKAGNPWVLGFDTEKPQWAEQFWPTPEDPAELVFPSAAQERSGAPRQQAAKTFPHHLRFGSYELSDGTITPQSSKAYAHAAQEALNAGEPVPAYDAWLAANGGDEGETDDADTEVGAGSVDPSWGR